MNRKWVKGEGVLVSGVFAWIAQEDGEEERCADEHGVVEVGDDGDGVQS